MCMGLYLHLKHDLIFLCSYICYYTVINVLYIWKALDHQGDLPSIRTTCLLTCGSIPFSSSNLTCDFTPLHLLFLFIFAFRATTDPFIRTLLANRADAVKCKKKRKEKRKKRHGASRILLQNAESLCSFCCHFLHLYYIWQKAERNFTLYFSLMECSGSEPMCINWRLRLPHNMIRIRFLSKRFDIWRLLCYVTIWPSDTYATNINQ